VQLAASLQGIVTQQLIPTADGSARAVGAEVRVATPAIRNLIREAKVHQIYSLMQAGAKHGMVSMDQSLAGLVRQGRVTMDTAIEFCSNEDDLRRLASSAASTGSVTGPAKQLRASSRPRTPRSWPASSGQWATPPSASRSARARASRAT
jgi:Tfp pilus assembly ATPase PilU